MTYYIFVFKNTMDAMNGEKKSLAAGLKFRMMPTPTSITQSCGLCVRVEEEEAVKRIIEENLFEFKNAYKKDENGYSLIK